MLKAAALLGAGLSMGLGAIGSGVGSGGVVGSTGASVTWTAGSSTAVGVAVAQAPSSMLNTIRAENR